MSLPEGVRRALDELVEGLDVAVDSIYRGEFSEELQSAERARDFLEGMLEQLPENDTERNVFNHYVQAFYIDNPLPRFGRNILQNRTLMLMFLAGMRDHFSSIGVLTNSAAINEMPDDGNDEGRDGSGEGDENTAPRLGFGRLRLGGNRFYFPG